MDDVFSDVLRLIRLNSCVYFVRDFWSPWAMRLDGASAAQFHVVLRGQCVVETKGRTLHGSPGDVFLFPKGTAHVLADAVGRSAVGGQDFFRSLATDAPLFSEGQAPTKLICGHYEFRDDFCHPLIEELPEVVHIDAVDNQSADILHSVIPALVRELNTGDPGASVVVERLAEVLLVQVIRAYFDQAAWHGGFLAGLFDKRLAQAIRLIHTRFNERLGLDQLADAAGMSRSAFALHFKTIVGIAPVAYLAFWRMCRARELLDGNGLAVSQVAISVGYESEVAFSRAFKRQFGASPASVRRAARATTSTQL